MDLIAPKKQGYIFVGWSASLRDITNDIEVYPIYKKDNSLINIENKNVSEESSNNNIVKTSDNNNIILFIILFSISINGMLLVVKKENI